jgi:transposase InsO family protein
LLKKWLAAQALFQVHLPRPKHIDYAHFYVTKVNKIHQADLMYLPHDTVYGNTYKYVLNVIDIASEYKASRPLKTKKASEVAEMFKDIYKKGALKYPEELHVDNGTEFKSSVDKLMKEHNVVVKRVTTKYHHKFTAFVESFNGILAPLLFKIQDAQELNDPLKDSKTWVKYLHKMVANLNNKKLDRIKTTPSKAA